MTTTSSGNSGCAWGASAPQRCGMDTWMPGMESSGSVAAGSKRCGTEVVGLGLFYFFKNRLTMADTEHRLC